MRVKLGKYRDDGKKRKVKIRIDPWDTWDMDRTLAQLIVPMLKQLAETTHGYPNDVDGHSAWIGKLGEMIWAFESLLRDDYYETHNNSWEGRRDHCQRVQRGIDSFAKYFLDLWD